MYTPQQDRDDRERDRSARRLPPRSSSQNGLSGDVRAPDASPRGFDDSILLTTGADKSVLVQLHNSPVADDSTASPSANNTIITSDTMPQYTSRDVGDPTQIKKNKQSMADLKLRRLTELNNRLREDLERERIPVSQASKR